MKAWELERSVILNEVPCYNANDNEVIWEENASAPEIAQDNLSRMYWHSQVPGSRAKESICLAAIEATENKGMVVEGAMANPTARSLRREITDTASATFPTGRTWCPWWPGPTTPWD